VVDPGAGLRVIQEISERGDCFLGPSQVRFETGQVVDDHLVTTLDVCGVEHGVDVLEWHIEVAEAADDMSSDNLFCGVAPVSGLGVDVDWLQ
jgi:hypothetical protein